MMREALSSFFQYIKKPFYIGHNRKIDACELLFLGGVYLVCGFFLVFVMKCYYEITHIHPRIAHLDIANNILLSSIFIAVLSPIKEEVQFRLLLRPKKSNLLLFNGVMLLTSIVFIYYEKWQSVIFYLIIAGLVSILFIFFPQKIKLLYNKYFAFLFYFSASIFALLHINNYDGDSFYIKWGF